MVRGHRRFHGVVACCLSFAAAVWSAEVPSATGQRADVSDLPQTLAVTNPTGAALLPTIRIMGRTRYADASGLRIGSHWYIVLDAAKLAENLEGASVARNAHGSYAVIADDDDFLIFGPNGSAEVEFVAPEAGVYRLRFPCPQYGNTVPVLEVALDGRTIGGGGVIEDVPLTAGRHVLTLKEAGYEPIVPSSRLVRQDLIEITTDRQEDFPGSIEPHPSDPDRPFWKRRSGIPLSNPKISDGRRAFVLNRTLADGDLVIIHPDGTVSTGFDAAGPAAREDERGLEAGDNFYFRIDPCQVGQLDNSTREASARAKFGVTGSHRDCFVFLRPGGSVTVPLSLPRGGLVVLAARVHQHGDSPATGRFLVDGKQVGAFQHGGAYRWHKVQVDLEEGAHTLTIQECGTAGAPNTDQMNLDVIEVSSDPDVPLPDAPVEGRLPRFSAPLVEPADVSLNRVPLLSPGDNSLTFSDADFSSHGAAVEIDLLQWLRLEKDVSVLTPNGDGVADEVQVTATVTEGAACTLTVVDAFGRIVRRLVADESAHAGKFQAVWDGRNDGGELAPYGSYELRLVAGRDGGPVSRWTTVVGLDPQVRRSVETDLAVFSPNGDDIWDTVSLTYRLAEPANLRVTVLNEQDQTVRRLFEGERPTGIHQISWDGSGDEGQVLPGGSYRFRVATAEGLLIGTCQRPVELDAGYSWPDVPAQARDFFPIGVWFGGAGRKSVRELLRMLKQDGFNTVYETSPKIAAEEGMKTISGYFCRERGGLYGPPLDEREVTLMMEREVRFLKDSPGLLAYYVADEPHKDEVYARNLALLTRAIAKEDPVHPTVACLIGTDRLDFHTKRAPRGVLFIDIYPVWPTNAIGDFRSPLYDGWDMCRYFDYAQALVGPETPTWVVVQCHSFMRLLREPTPEEIRCQTYLNLAHGAKGILYFTLYSVGWPGLLDPDDKPTPRYEECARLARVMQKLAPTMLKLILTENVAAVNGGGNASCEHGEVTTLRHSETGGLYVWAVNRNCEEPDRLVISARGPASVRVRDVLTGETVESESIEDGVRWSCDLAPGEGKLFALER